MNSSYVRTYVRDVRMTNSYSITERDGSCRYVVDFVQPRRLTKSLNLQLYSTLFSTKKMDGSSNGHTLY